MAEYQTEQLGVIEYNEESVVEFPEGLPAFENETRFVVVERAGTAPVIFLQSLVTPTLCFVTLPLECVERGYEFHVPAGELRDLGVDRAPALGDAELLCLAIVTLREKKATANLMAPVVIHRKTRRGRQLIQRENVYSFEKVLWGGSAGEEDEC